MTDSVDCLTANLNAGDVESEIQTWLNDNAVTSVDDIEVTKKTSKRAIITIAYTA